MSPKGDDMSAHKVAARNINHGSCKPQSADFRFAWPSSMLTDPCLEMSSAPCLRLVQLLCSPGWGATNWDANTTRPIFPS